MHPPIEQDGWALWSIQEILGEEKQDAINDTYYGVS